MNNMNYNVVYSWSTLSSKIEIDAYPLRTYAFLMKLSMNVKSEASSVPYRHVYHVLQHHALNIMLNTSPQNSLRIHYTFIYM